MTLEQQQHCQRIQDERGYLVIGWLEEVPVGHIIGDAEFSLTEQDALPKLRVIGSATADEFRQQHRRYQGCEPRGIFTHFMKCVAE